MAKRLGNDAQGDIVLNESILEQLNELFLPYSPSDEGRFFALEFLKRSRDDLRDSILLYQNRSYANSVFLFQQSVEKAVKSLLYATNILREEKDAYSRRIGIGHDSIAAFEKFFAQIAPIGERMAKIGLVQGYEDVQPENVTNILREEYGDAQIESSRLVPMILVLHFLHSLFAGNKPEQIKEMALRAMMEPSLLKGILGDSVYEEMIRMSGLNLTDPEVKRAIEDVIDRMMEVAVEAKGRIQTRSALTMMTLIVAAIITCPHEKTTRYPTLVTGRLNPEMYDIDLGIVQNLPSFFMLHGQSIQFLKNHLVEFGILKEG